jgi:hypothetical protein
MPKSTAKRETSKRTADRYNQIARSKGALSKDVEPIVEIVRGSEAADKIRQLREARRR